MARVMLLLGGNIGDVESTINRAAEMIEARIGEITNRSTMMVSEAWGFNAATASFTNQAIEVESDKTPDELLEATQSIERELGRDRSTEATDKAASGERYCSRMIDVDIILYDELIYESERLSIPHPLMQQREFVLRPIAQIAPEWCNARFGKSCRELLELITK